MLGNKQRKAAAQPADLGQLEAEIAELTRRQTTLQAEISGAQRELGNLVPAPDTDLGDLQIKVSGLQSKVTAGTALLKSVTAKLEGLQQQLAAGKELAAAVAHKQARIQLDAECEELAAQMAAVAERARELGERMLVHDQFSGSELRAVSERVTALISTISPMAKAQKEAEWHASQRAYQENVNKQRATRQKAAERQAWLDAVTAKQAGSGAWVERESI